MKNKSLLLSFILIIFLIPSKSYANTDDNFATLIWEGVVHNSNYFGEIMKVRITIDGVIGEQIAPGKVNVYSKPIYDNYQTTYIIPVVETGSIKLEYLGTEDGLTYQDSEITIGMTSCDKVVECSYRDEGYEADPYTYYMEPQVFYANEDFRYDPNKETPIRFSEFKPSDSYDDGTIALIFFDLPDDNLDQPYLQAFTESKGKTMLQELKNGHNSITLGQSFDDPKEEKKVFKMEYPKMDKAALEQKYGVTIKVEDGFWPKDSLLSMMDKIYSRFPDGLIKEMTSYYKAKGIDTIVNFQYKQTNLGGSFSDKGNITLNYYPNPIGDSFADWTIGHEMGHYVHKYINEIYGYNKLKDEWISINNGLGYQNEGCNEWTDEHYKYFVRDYSTTNYSEDFATLFEELTKDNAVELRLNMMNDSNYPLKKKIDLLDRVLVEKAKCVTSSNNLWGNTLPQTVSDSLKTACENASKSGLIPEGDAFVGLYTSNITRTDFCVLISKLIEKHTNMTLAEFVESKGLKENWYYDMSIAGGGECKIDSNYPFCDTSYEFIFDLHSLGIINGVSDCRFNPDGLLTKEQVATILYKTATILGKDMNYTPYQYADNDKISSWAKESVNYATSKKLVTANSDNMFLPKDYFTYEEAYTAVYNLFCN
ncbi:hypothetical protein SH1V18_21310 [Vallitalea longa]|uniref:SLH domain-containing protein n=1 Tax=Vallitalea longa TaxID=2936439 RepID=A0A9W5YBW0_9FIRM|nr:S-layer homology domain-containing protein [Vallitalea longa]GKX29651.1 hypothetical protein SH1V18_21310 [Vallitalea longa]